ncbi:MAG: retropepsin-like domain-containing protein, partial [Myxococcota bacterium]|nr:retropepsin-like domain-containing protein [Myxococcota bacterium]
PEAPRVTLQTANGTIEASLVLVDAVWLGKSAVEWVTVAVCESCANPPAVGLLGLNVAQRFHVALDHDRQTIDLRRNEYGDNRALDIRNWLQIRSEATESWDGSVSVKLTGFNASRQAIKSAVIDLDCSGAGFAIELGEIPPRGESSAEAELPRGTNCREQTLDLARAYWKLDRFD